MAVEISKDSGVSVHDDDNQWVRSGGSIDGLDINAVDYEEQLEEALKRYEELGSKKKAIDERLSGVAVEQDYVESVEKSERILSKVVPEVGRQKSLLDQTADVLTATQVELSELKVVVGAQNELIKVLETQHASHREQISETWDLGQAAHTKLSLIVMEEYNFKEMVERLDKLDIRMDKAHEGVAIALTQSIQNSAEIEVDKKKKTTKKKTTVKEAVEVT